MTFSSPRCGVDLSKGGLVGQMFSRHAAHIACLLLVLMLMTGSVRAQQATAVDSDKQTIQMLVRRIDQLEARVAQLESSKAQAAGATSESAPPPSVASAEIEPESPAEHGEPERMDVSKTLLKIRGFGDVTFHGDNAKGDTTSFTLGQLDLFVTSDLSEKFKFLSEIVFEAGDNNGFGVDLERYLLQYSPNDYFNVSVGRYHTAIGYYNTAYHHSTWLQTATGRPFLFQFEDDDGILPIHNVGISATGLIPSGRLGLHYVAELGNGRAYTPGAEFVQNTVDENNGKSFNLGFFIRPAAVRGLQAGFSVYHDGLKPIGLPGISETIFAAHAVVVRPSFEWLNEALLIRHAPGVTSRVFETPGFYTQLSRRFGSYRPYFRYQYVNASDAEPVFPTVGLRHGPSVGLRFDPSESVALKLQYDYTALRHQPSTSGLAAQLGFTF
ncbi:MAG: hypothetical protein LAO56_04695 [Acidobacteriia bacterium]|nr:hypothetical protein [Terriglobia bacterium]